jgi:hypothetical protein
VESLGPNKISDTASASLLDFAQEIQDLLAEIEDIGPVIGTPARPRGHEVSAATVPAQVP